jgi:hypothetical protein
MLYKILLDCINLECFEFQNCTENSSLQPVNDTCVPAGCSIYAYIPGGPAVVVDNRNRSIGADQILCNYFGYNPKYDCYRFVCEKEPDWSPHLLAPGKAVET